MQFTILSPNSSARTNQKDRLPIISAKAVMITAPIAENSRNRKNRPTLKLNMHITRIPYKKSPIAEVFVDEVITLSRTFFGITR